MADELLSILRPARRKLLAVRAAESACAMVAVGALCAAAGELAWAAASWREWAGVAIAAASALAVVTAAAAAGVSARRRKAGSTILSPWLAAILALAVGVLVAWGIFTGLHLRLPKVSLAAAAVLLAAVLGVAAALARGAGLRQVAAMLDAKAGLRERLSTAAELALSASPPPASAPVVRGQALAALRDRRPQDMPMWSAPAALPAAMALALAMCLALAFLPDFGPPRGASRIERFSRSVAAMTDAQREQLAAAFRQAAARGQLSPAVAQELARAAAVVEVKDAAELQRILRKLQEAGFAPLGAVPRDLLPASLAEETPAATAADDSSGAGGQAAPPPEANEPAKMPGGYVAVYNPDYARYALPGGSEANRPLAAPPAAVPYADAWAAARARALDSAQRGTVPPAYRRLVYDFFARQE